LGKDLDPEDDDASLELETEAGWKNDEEDGANDDEEDEELEDDPEKEAYEEDEGKTKGARGWEDEVEFEEEEDDEADWGLAGAEVACGTRNDSIDEVRGCLILDVGPFLLLLSLGVSFLFLLFSF